MSKVLMSTLLCLPMLASAPASAAAPQCEAVDNSSPTAVKEAASAYRRNDQLLQVLEKKYGALSACKGSMQDPEGHGWVAMYWPDHSVFKIESMAPETSIATLTRSNGVRDKNGVIEALRKYAAARGLHIDWTKPAVEHNDAGRVETFEDKDPGVNGIARLTYSRDGALVALSLSIAL